MTLLTMWCSDSSISNISDEALLLVSVFLCRTPSHAIARRMRQDGILEQAWWWLASYLGQPATMPSQATRTYMLYLYHTASKHKSYLISLCWRCCFSRKLFPAFNQLLMAEKRGGEVLLSIWLETIMMMRSHSLSAYREQEMKSRGPRGLQLEVRP